MVCNRADENIYTLDYLLDQPAAKTNKKAMAKSETDTSNDRIKAIAQEAFADGAQRNGKSLSTETYKRYRKASDQRHTNGGNSINGDEDVEMDEERVIDAENGEEEWIGLE